MWSGAANLRDTNDFINEFNATHPSIHVTQLEVPSSDAEAKLLSSISAGDPPDMFTEWNPEIGTYAQSGAIQPLNQFLVGSNAAIVKELYPVALQGGEYDGKLVAIPMSMNSFALYYNKSIMAAAGIMAPPTTQAQFMADQAKEWKFSGSRIIQEGFYPGTQSPGFPMFMPYFGGNEKLVNGKFDLAGNAGALAAAKFYTAFAKYPYSTVTAFEDTYGNVSGFSSDPFDVGKEGFLVSGPWDAIEQIPVVDPAMEKNYGVVSFPRAPGVSPAPVTWVNGNYNIIPKGAKDAAAAFTFMTWLAGGGTDVNFIGHMMSVGGWMPPTSTIAATPAFKQWVSSAPALKPFLAQLNSPGSFQTPLSPAESEFNNATTTASQYLLTGKMTPIQALNYVDSQANNALKQS